ncbi:sirohydrochlorin chelatase [Nocardioides sp. cx-173]|uniref:sirohydrochlorin chelatase n=1 Tax=Nocardioides sp. cx-173 TaxID=2898796 RepID=UPI001E63173C|nr:sirohydrochlorin chelatase [Nocardioides sp. cx-173]MCD4523407.1 sirohydrochlorin chelatase [Nocardioides sp. cx-173]UGB42254.1 sirohydrochlorin chelatase [Nocardioides sp. cx-173]
MRLVTVAHGTRSAAGNEVARTLTARAGRALGVEAVCSYVELSEPLFEDVVASSPPSETTMVVPLLLSTGFHVRQDLPRMARGAVGPVLLGRPLGPHHLLAEVQHARLVAAGAAPGARVVMVAAGSADPLATGDLTRAAELLARRWGAPVEVATLSALGRRPAEVVRPGDAVSPYLLSPGFFADRARRESLDAGAVCVADVIGPDPLVADLVVQRARALGAV